MNFSGTTRKRLTLVDLDKRVSSSGGGKPAARARASAAALSADVLSQIDLLRGHSQRSRKRGVAALLDVHPRRTQKKGAITVRAYDVGAPVQIGAVTADAFGVAFGADGGSWRSFAYRGDEDPMTTGFAVEVFEEEPRVTASVDEVSLPRVSPEPAAVTAPPIVLTPPSPSTQTEVPIAAALSAGQREDGFLGLDLSAAAASDREDAEQFEREIQAILSGKTTRPAAQSAPSALPVAPAPVAAPASRPHDIFEQMGQNMAYATAFDLPPMELGRRFDELEHEITRDEQAQARRPAEMSLELTDDDISASLGLGRAFQSMLPPITVLPITPPIAAASPALPASPATVPVPAVIPDVTAPAPVVRVVTVTAPESTTTTTPAPAPATGAPAPAIAPAVTDAIQPTQDKRAKP